MRRGFGLIGLLGTVILLVIVGAIAYNVGWSEGVNTHLPAATQAGGAPAYYYGPHFFGAGFGIFGLLWFLLIVFGLFWLFRIAFFGRRMGPQGRLWLRSGPVVRGARAGVAQAPARRATPVGHDASSATSD